MLTTQLMIHVIHAVAVGFQTVNRLLSNGNDVYHELEH